MYYPDGFEIGSGRSVEFAFVVDSLSQLVVDARNWVLNKLPWLREDETPPKSCQILELRKSAG